MKITYDDNNIEVPVSLSVCPSPEEDELRMALHTLMARELTGTGNTDMTDSTSTEGKETGKEEN